MKELIFSIPYLKSKGLQWHVENIKGTNEFQLFYNEEQIIEMLDDFFYEVSTIMVALLLFPIMNF